MRTSISLYCFVFSCARVPITTTKGARRHSCSSLVFSLKENNPIRSPNRHGNQVKIAGKDDKDKSVPQKSDKEKGFDAFTSICFTVNYLIGTGFLTLPWAFSRGGLLLSTITMVMVVMICNTTKNYILATMARAEVLQNAETSKGELDDRSKMSSKILKKQTYEPTAETLMIKNRKFEYAELCRIFLGDAGEFAYVCSVTIAILLQLWSYTVVFALAMANILPIFSGDTNYAIYALAFGAVVVPLSCLDLKEQVGFQISLSLCRFLVIYLMIRTVMVAANDHSGAVYFTSLVDDSVQGAAKMINWNGFYEMFSVLVYTAMFHNGIPELAEPVRDKKRLSQNFRSAILIVSAACWFLGTTVASYFGDAVQPSANLNWNDYIGGTGHFSSDGVWLDVQQSARLTSGFIVLFPPLNVMSAYPLNAIVLGNNLLVGLFGASAEVSTCFDQQQNDLLFYQLTHAFSRLLSDEPSRQTIVSMPR